MKLIPPESIKENEKEFIDTINAELDWESIENLLMEKHQFTLQEEIEYKNGDLIVHNNQIAYQFDFEVKVPLSVIFNRNGECIEMNTHGYSADETGMPADEPDSPEDGVLEAGIDEPPPKESSHKEKVEQMASDIADMIHEINQGDE